MINWVLFSWQRFILLRILILALLNSLWSFCESFEKLLSSIRSLIVSQILNNLHYFIKNLNYMESVFLFIILSENRGRQTKLSIFYSRKAISSPPKVERTMMIYQKPNVYVFGMTPWFLVKNNIIFIRVICVTWSI